MLQQKGDVHGTRIVITFTYRHYSYSELYYESGASLVFV